MPVATGAIVAIAASSAASSAAASRIAQESKCKVIDGSFDARTATVQEKREYAECVRFQHPNPPNQSEVVFMKIAFVIALIGFVIGFIKGKDAFYRNVYVSGVLAGFCGFFLLPAFCAILFLIACGIGWLFT